MARIYRLKDRIPVKIDTLTVTISPLTLEQKVEVQTIMMQAVKDPFHSVKGAKAAIKYSVKSISGVEDMDGNPYALEFTEQGHLTDECIDDLLNMQESVKLTIVCSTLISGIPTTIINPRTGQPLEGVSLELASAKKSTARKQK